MDQEATVEQTVLGGINNPDMDPSTLVAGRTALTDETQAWSVFENIRQGQSTRNNINAQIVDNANGKPPYTATEIQPWQSNFSTLFLSGIIDKIVPVLVSYVENAKYLTQSKLKDESQAGEEKSDKLRNLFTKTVRQWPGWRSCVSSLCQELILIGYTFAIRTDEYNWRVKHYRQDQAFVPEATPQFAEFVQVLCIEQDILISEMADIIEDTEAAKAAKWDVENCVDALNKAFPIDETNKDQGNNPRALVDAIQEGNCGMSYSKGAKVIQLGHVLVIETTQKGKVTHVILDRISKKKLLWHEARFDSMRDVVTLFTLDPGNGNFYGSRGVGRRTVNYSVAMNAAVNDLVDQLRLAGLFVLQQDLSKGTPPPRIKRPFLWLNKDSIVVQQRPGLSTNIEAGVTLINKLAEMAQIATQQYVPNTIAEDTSGANRSHPTAHQVSIDYQREQQSTASFIGRFAGQLAEMIGMMQRAMCNPDTNDDEAKEFREMALGNDKKDIPAIVTEDELQEWAHSPAAEVLQDLSAQENQAKLSIANDPEIIQSPAINQKVRLEMKLGSVLPQPLVKSLIKPDFIDPDEEAENFRQQQSETEDILKGLSVPVSGRDNHKVHLDVLLPDMMKGGAGIQQKIQQNPALAADPSVGESLDHLHAGLTHADAHVQKWAAQAPPKEAIAPYAQAVEAGKKNLTRLAQELLKTKGAVDQNRAVQMQALQAQAQGAKQPQGGQGAAAPGEPVATSGNPLPFTEKIATSWIAQYDKMPSPEQRRLEMLTSLSTPATEAADTAAEQQAAPPPPPIEPPGPATIPPPPQPSNAPPPEQA